LVKKIARLEGVTEAEKRIEETVYLRYKDEEINAQFVGTSTPNSEVYESPLEKGDLLTKDDEKK